MNVMGLPPETPRPVSPLAPEHPRLALRIGLVGNREAAGPVAVDAPEVRTAVTQLLRRFTESVRNVHRTGHYDGEKPLLRFVTGLASGSDQMLIQQAFAPATAAVP